VDGDAPYSAEGLEDACDSALEALAEVEGDGFGDDGVPALLVDADALLEAGEEVVALVEVPAWEGAYL
jgi:hypothetical protein